MSRTVITRTMVDELLAGGTTELHLEPGAIVTALAAEHAQDRGLRLIPARPTGTAPTPAPPAPVRAPEQTLPAPQPPGAGHDAVRRAVVAALGHEPGGLDAIIDRVIKG